MDYFHVGDIVVVKPEYSEELIRSYSSGYSDAKCKFGRAVARGAPAKVVHCHKSEIVKVSDYTKEYLTFGGSSGWLTDLEETLQCEDYLHLSSAYFDLYMPPIPDGLL